MNKTFFSLVLLATMGFVGYKYFRHAGCTSCSHHTHHNHSHEHDHSHDHNHQESTPLIVNLNSVEDLDTLLKQSHPAFIKIYLDGCPPCRQAGLVYPEVAAQFPHVKFYELNVSNADVVNALLEKNVLDAPITAAPTFLYIKDGKVVEILRGFSGKDIFLEEVTTLFNK